jgi:hypothetical protein
MPQEGVLLEVCSRLDDFIRKIRHCFGGDKFAKRLKFRSCIPIHVPSNPDFSFIWDLAEYRLQPVHSPRDEVPFCGEHESCSALTLGSEKGPGNHGNASLESTLEKVLRRRLNGGKVGKRVKTSLWRYAFDAGYFV